MSKQKMGHVGVIVGHGDVKSGEAVAVAGVDVDAATLEEEGDGFEVALLSGKVKSCAAAGAGDSGDLTVAIVGGRADVCGVGTER